MSAASELVEAREQHSLRVEAHRALEERFSDMWMLTNRLQKEGKASAALDLTAQRIRIGEDRDLAKQMLGMASARVMRCERALLDDAKKALRKQYAKQAADLATTLVALVEADQRAGDTPQCPGLARFAVPAWDRMRSDDSGLIEGFYTLDQHRADGVALLNALLVAEEPELPAAIAEDCGHGAPTTSQPEAA